MNAALHSAPRPRPAARRGGIAIRAAAVACWLGAMGWLVRFEAFPERFTHALPGYRGLFSSGLLVRDSWMKVLLAGRPIGYTFTQVSLNEKDPVRHVTVHNQTALRLNLMGDTQNVTVSTQANLNSAYDLQEFLFLMASDAYRMRIDGRRNARNNFRVTVASAGGRRRVVNVTVPDDVMIYSPMTEMAVLKLRPGQSMTVRTLDPASLAPAHVLLRNAGAERIRVGGSEREATLLQIEYRGMTSRAWVGADGTMLRQETPFGLTLETATADEAREVLGTGRDRVDITRVFAVACTGAVPAPRSCAALRLRIRGAKLDLAAVRSARQVVAAQDEDAAELRVFGLGRFDPAQAAPETEASLKPFLAPSQFIQSDDPAMVRQAGRIVGAERDRTAAARAIGEWVYRHVEKKPAASLPSASDVLRHMTGDCNEHAYLAVALLRAAGIPAKVKVGLVYSEDAFYFHAWVAAYAGRWVEMDPTFGQPEVDATHIALVEGEVGSQVDLLRLLGQLRIEIIASEQGADKT